MAHTSNTYAAYYGYPTSPSGAYSHYQRPSATSTPGPKQRPSDDYEYSRPPPQPSYRYSSADQYASRPEYVSAKYQRRAPPVFRSQAESSSRRRSTSESFRASHGDSDDDEWIIHDGKAYFVPGARRKREEAAEAAHESRQHSTNHRRYQDVRYVDRYGNPVYVTEEVQYERPSTPRRRTSTSTPKQPSTGTRQSSSSKPKKTTPLPKTRVATEVDAKKYAIPPGFSLKNWDPDEEPLILLGSVFDGNSLGKWIYDWTVYRHEAGTPISDVAGELWLLLIALSGKVKRAEECVPRIRSTTNRDMVEDFIEGGQRLTDKLQALLKLCETPMLKTGKSRSGKERPQLGKNAGTEFVDSIFGRDRYMERTEKLMSSIRLWSMRFDANCEDILRRPAAH